MIIMIQNNFYEPG